MTSADVATSTPRNLSSISSSSSTSSTKANGREGEERKSDASSRAGSMSVADLLSSSSSEAKAALSEVYKKQNQSTSRSPVEDDNEENTRSGSTSSVNIKPSSDSAAITEAVAAYQYTAMQQVTENRENIEYKLTIREQPKHSRMCGVGEKADRRPIDPAPIIQLRVITHDHGPPASYGYRDSSSAMTKQRQDDQDEVKVLSQNTVSSSLGSKGNVVSASPSPAGGKFIRRGVPVQTSWGDGWEDKTWYLENPYYFMYAMLADAETDEELHLLQDGKTRFTTGSCVSCLYHLKDIDGSEQGFFVFPDLSIRVEGRYRLKLCLFETIGHEVHHCKSVYSTPFNVYTAKRFPGMEESTMLSKSFADQGLKVRVRKNPRPKRGRLSGKRKDAVDSEEDSDERMAASDMVPEPQPSMKRVKSNEQEYMRQAYEQPHRPAMSHPQRPGEARYSAMSPHRERRYTTEGAINPGHAFGHQGVEMPGAGREGPSRRGQEMPALVRMSSDPRLTGPPPMASHPSRSDPYAYRQHHPSDYPEDRFAPRHAHNSHTAYQERAPPPVMHAERGSTRVMAQEHGHARYHPSAASSRDYAPPPPPPPIRSVASDREQAYRRQRSPPPHLPRSEEAAMHGKDEYGARHDVRNTLPPLHVALSPRVPSQSQGETRPRASSGASASSRPVEGSTISRHMPPPPSSRSRVSTHPSEQQQQPHHQPHYPHDDGRRRG